VVAVPGACSESRSPTGRRGRRALPARGVPQRGPVARRPRAALYRGGDAGRAAGVRARPRHPERPRRRALVPQGRRLRGEPRHPHGAGAGRA
jgi:hypothetical protein